MVRLFHSCFAAWCPHNALIPQKFDVRRQPPGKDREENRTMFLRHSRAVACCSIMNLRVMLITTTRKSSMATVGHATGGRANCPEKLCARIVDKNIARRESQGQTYDAMPENVPFGA